MLLREAIDLAFNHAIIIRQYGSLQYQLSYREDGKATGESRLCDSLEEAMELIPQMRKERDEEQSGDVRF